MGKSVGAVGTEFGAEVTGAAIGARVVGRGVGDEEGLGVGTGVGSEVGTGVGALDGTGVGASVGGRTGATVGKPLHLQGSLGENASIWATIHSRGSNSKFIPICSTSKHCCAPMMPLNVARPPPPQRLQNG